MENLSYQTAKYFLKEREIFPLNISTFILQFSQKRISYFSPEEVFDYLQEEGIEVRDINVVEAICINLSRAGIYNFECDRKLKCSYRFANEKYCLIAGILVEK